MNSILCDSICLWSYTFDIKFFETSSRNLRNTHSYYENGLVVLCHEQTWCMSVLNLDRYRWWFVTGKSSDHLELLNDDTRQRSYASRVDYLRMSPFLQDYLSSFTWLQNHLFEHWFDFTHSCRLSSIWEVWIGALMTTQRQEKWSQVHIWHSFYV